MAVGTDVQGLGQVVESSATGVEGPIGLEGYANREINSPGETGPWAKLAAFVIWVIVGTAVPLTVKDTPTVCAPLAVCSEMVPLQAEPADTPD
jgi:hypothetical protein